MGPRARVASLTCAPATGHDSWSKQLVPTHITVRHAHDQPADEITILPCSVFSSAQNGGSAFGSKAARRSAGTLLSMVYLSHVLSSSTPVVGIVLLRSSDLDDGLARRVNRALQLQEQCAAAGTRPHPSAFGGSTALVVLHANRGERTCIDPSRLECLLNPYPQLHLRPPPDVEASTPAPRHARCPLGSGE